MKDFLFTDIDRSLNFLEDGDHLLPVNHQAEGKRLIPEY
jgi:hypothetical protein